MGSLIKREPTLARDTKDTMIKEMLFLVLLTNICVLPADTFAETQRRTVPTVGTLRSTTVTKRDGSKEVIYPNGKHEFFNPNGIARNKYDMLLWSWNPWLCPLGA